ncbi:MAG: hypothetical protein IPJ30_23030 [Acidobacteria bacterium]|nr:hypothetical protein [Acidobacteriota bacterium]
MKITTILIVILLFVGVTGTVHAQFEPLQVKLLKTKRLEIERRFPVSGSNKWSVKIPTESGRFTVSFITKRCEEGWNVEPDVVSSVRLEYDSNFVKPPDDIRTGRYFPYTNDIAQQFFFDEVSGLTYELDPSAEYVVSIIKVPPLSEPTPRCKGFPTYNPVSDRYPKTEKITIPGNADFTIEIPMTVAALRATPSKRGYVFVYCGKRRTAKCSEVTRELEKYVAWALRSIKTQPVEVVVGGFRDEIEIETFVLDPRWSPPVARPLYPVTKKIRKTWSNSPTKSPLTCRILLLFPYISRDPPARQLQSVPASSATSYQMAYSRLMNFTIGAS